LGGTQLTSSNFVPEVISLCCHILSATNGGCGFLVLDQTSWFITIITIVYDTYNIL